MHEIVTLQFGQRANYLATHFWNLQESYFTYAPNAEPSIVDHDIHFRPGLGTDGSDTYTPRTVIYDLKGGFGTLKQRNILYDDTTSSEQACDDNGLSTIKQQPISQIPYQRDLDAGLPTTQLRANQIRYWSDFNRVFYHPRSIVQLNEYSLHSQLTPFESWSAGEELWRDVDREADLLDRDVRPFVEESDSMQGFQVFASVDDAWGGWTERYMDALRDEFGKKSIWVWGLEDTSQMTREKAIAKKANAAMSLAGIGRLVNGYVRLSSVPMHLPEYVRLQGNEWESTALMATAMESVTLPVRMRHGSVRGSTMAQFEQVLNTNEGQVLWDVGLSMKDHEHGTGQSKVDGTVQGTDVPEDEILEDDSSTFDVSFAPMSTSLLPQTTVRSTRKSRRHVFGQLEITRSPEKMMVGQKYAVALDREELMRRRYNEQAIVERFTMPLGFPRLDAFPATLFNPDDGSTAMEELSMLAGLDTNAGSKENVMELRDLVTRYTRAIALDNREELYNGLTEIAEKYAHGWDSGSGSEDE